MAIYKPSNFYPNLEEIDVLEDNIFSCQINTSGEPVKSYKVSILSGDGNDVLFDPVNPVVLTTPVKNKQILNIGWDKIFTKSGGQWKFPLRRTSTQTSMENGKDYQWGVRVYNTSTAAEMAEQPNTLVCDGFLVGSTKYVVWMNLPDHGEEGANKTVADQLVYDRYIEFNTPKSRYTSDLIIGAKDEETTYPSSDKSYYRERQKIDWVTKEIGRDKDFIKIETEKPFTYNYDDGVTFQIFQCSSEHTVKSAFADPNGNINVSQYIMIYNNLSDAQKSKNAEDTPAKMTVVPARCMMKEHDPNTSPTIDNTKARKMVGYSSDTGEIRVSDAFADPPENGQCYRIFSYNGATDVYEAVDDDNIETHIIGGIAIENAHFKVLNNKLANSNGMSITRLFIQPNINIKSDDSHFDEIVFDNGCRIDILKKTKTNEIDSTKLDDITFNKLDNTQWLLEGNMRVISTAIPLDKYGHIQPQTSYKVYTDFADTIPFNIFYARKTPNIDIWLEELNTTGTNIKLEKVDLATKKPDRTIIYRDVKFSVQKYWDNFIIEAPKYYKYSLYLVDEDANMELIAESNEIYNQDMVWTFRGLDGLYDSHQYRIVLEVVNEHDRSFISYGDFNVDYSKLSNDGISPLIVEIDCFTHSAQVEVNTPLEAICTDGDNGAECVSRFEKPPQFTWEQGLYAGINVIPPNNIPMLDYTHVDNLEKSALVFPQSMQFYSEFFIRQEFVDELTALFEKKKEQYKDNRKVLDRLSVERELWSIKHESAYSTIEVESEIPSRFINGRVYYFANNKVAKIVDKSLTKGFYRYVGKNARAASDWSGPISEADMLEDYTLTISNFEDVVWYEEKNHFIAPRRAHTLRLYKNIFDLVGNKDLNDFTFEQKEDYLVRGAFNGEDYKNIYTVYRNPKNYSNETRLLFALQNSNKYDIRLGAGSLNPNGLGRDSVNQKFYFDDAAAAYVFSFYADVPELWKGGIYRFTGERPLPWMALSEEYYLWLEDTYQIPDYTSIPDGYDEETYTVRGYATVYQPEMFADRYDPDVLSLEVPETCTPLTQWIQSPEMYINYSKEEIIQPILSTLQYWVHLNNANIEDLGLYGGRRNKPAAAKYEAQYVSFNINTNLKFEVHQYGTNDEFTDNSINNYTLVTLDKMVSMFSEKEEWIIERQNTDKDNPHTIYEDTRIYWKDETEAWNTVMQEYDTQPTVFIDDNGLWSGKDDIVYEDDTGTQGKPGRSKRFYYDTLGIAEVCNRLIKTTLIVDNTDELNEVVALDIDMNTTMGTNRGRSW